MDYETLGAVVLVGLLLFVSLDFDKHYVGAAHDAARHPFARFLAGMTVCLIAAVHPTLAALALTVVFFWIADVNLLSSFQL